MQKWQYCFLSINYENNAWRVKFVDGKEIANWKNGVNVYEYANQMGDDGWELVSAPYTLFAKVDAVFGGYEMNVKEFRLIFKRPRQ